MHINYIDLKERGLVSVETEISGPVLIKGPKYDPESGELISEAEYTKSKRTVILVRTVFKPNGDTEEIREPIREETINGVKEEKRKLQSLIADVDALLKDILPETEVESSEE